MKATSRIPVCDQVEIAIVVEINQLLILTGDSGGCRELTVAIVAPDLSTGKQIKIAIAINIADG